MINTNTTSCGDCDGDHCLFPNGSPLIINQLYLQDELLLPLKQAPLIHTPGYSIYETGGDKTKYSLLLLIKAGFWENRGNSAAYKGYIMLGGFHLATTY